MSLLTIVSDVSKQLAIGVPSAVAASSDTQTRQFLRLANLEGRELARRFNWSILTEETTFTTLAAETQVTVTTLAADFLRIIDKTMWNRSQSQPVWGPLSPQQWQAKKASAAQAGFGNWFRIRENLLLFFPTPTAGETVAFEYISKNWAASSAGTPKEEFTADDDVSRIDEEIIKLGVLWRFLANKGADYAEEFRAYEQALHDIFGPDGSNPTIDMTPEYPILGAHFPEGSWSIS